MDALERRRPDGAGAPPGRAGSTALRAFAALLVLVVAALAVVVLARSQSAARLELEERFAARGELAAGFVSAFAEQVLARELAVAQGSLTGQDVQRPLDAVVTSVGFRSALLLDSTGAVLSASPPDPVVGRVLAPSYEHLSLAGAGTPAISPVIASATDGVAIVAFARPFDTPSGRRVLSGAFDVRETPFESYLNAFSTLRGYRALVVDADGRVVSASRDAQGMSLADSVPGLGSELRDEQQGLVGEGRATEFYAVHDVAGTPWQLVTTVPEVTLLEPVSGVSRLLPWAILAGLVVTALVAYVLALRLLDGRRRLESANHRLDALASIDALTGVFNRRRGVEVLREQLARCGADQVPLSVLVIDVDHFKRVNDSFGHASGDEVLREVATRLARVLRDDDVLVRWGGEEFLVVLPGTELFDARSVGERLRAAIADRPVPLGSGGDEIDVTVSIGVASSTHGSPEVLVHTADKALYAAKSAGRNLVIASTR